MITQKKQESTANKVMSNNSSIVKTNSANKQKLSQSVSLNSTNKKLSGRKSQRKNSNLKHIKQVEINLDENESSLNSRTSKSSVIKHPRESVHNIIGSFKSTDRSPDSFIHRSGADPF